MRPRVKNSGSLCFDPARLTFSKLVMILSDRAILDAIQRRDIVIEPYDRTCLGTNSYDVHLSPHLACYVDDVIDARKHNQVEHLPYPKMDLF